MEINQHSSKISIILLSLVFFFWGLLTSLNGMLVPFLKEVFNLSYVESNYIQLVFYLAPLIICLPAASLLVRVGFIKAIQLSLLLLMVGCFLFVPASMLFSFPLFLLAIFIFASGIAVLQLAANPLAVSIGSQQTASSRLTFCSAMNSVGTIAASGVGMGIFMGALAYHSEDAVKAVQIPYMIIGLSSVFLAYILKNIGSKISMASAALLEGGQWRDLFKYRSFIYGSVAIFFYVGSEVSVGTFLISYLTNGDLLNMNVSVAGIFVSCYWGGALVGRLFGSAILTRVPSHVMLRIHSLGAIGLLFIAVIFPNTLGAWCLALVGLCNSVMYPVIFSMASQGLGNLVAKASAILIMCGVGGALVPLLQALVADYFGLLESFVIPIIGYILILSFSLYSFISVRKVVSYEL